MPDLTVSSDVDSFMAAASKAAMRSVLDITLGGAFATSGAFATTLTVTGNTNVTLPTSGTLAILGGNIFTSTQTITQSSANSGIITSTGYSLTGSDITSMINLAGTWNTTGAPTAIKLNLVNTASSSSSLFSDYQLGGVSRFAVGLNGISRINDGSAAVGSLLMSSTGTYLTLGTTSGAVVLNSGGNIFGAWSGHALMSATTSLSWCPAGLTSLNPDTSMVREAADTIAIRRSSNACSFRVYGTYTDASNYVRGCLKSTSTLVTLCSETSGTGADNVDISIMTSGTGLVNFSNQSASVDAAVSSTHTFRMKIGGTEYKVLIASP